MRADLVLQLRKLFPDVFKEGAHIICDDGWFDILVCLGVAATDAGEAPSFSYIKEKWAQLEAYPTPQEPISKGALKLASERSMETCELCGKPGRTVTNINEWWDVRCFECQDPDHKGLDD